MKLFIFFLLLNTTFFIGSAVLNPTIIKKLANYLMLHKNVQTEVFIERIEGKWVYNRIIRENSIDDELKVSFIELKEFLGKREAKHFLNEAKFKFNISSSLKFKLKKFFHINTDGIKFKVKKIFNLVKKDYIILDYEYYERLNEQSFCLVNFLVKKIGTDNVIGFVGPEELTEETAIEHEFSIYHRGKYYFYRLNIKSDFLKECYYEETEEFKQLYKCNIIIEESEPQYEVDENGRKFIDLNKLYKRFNPKQLYFNYIPIFEEKEILNENSNVIKNKDVCSICFTDFVIEDSVITTPCRHTFHINCIQTVLENYEICPVCRQLIHLQLIPKLTEY